MHRIRTIDTHTMGEPTRIVVEGIPTVPGNSILEKKRYIENNLDYIRTSLLFEPRGHRDMFGAIILPPTVPEADFGVVFMDSGGYLNMCGHGTIGAVTALLETGMLSYRGLEVPVILETPAGLVKVKTEMKNLTVRSVSFQNVPAFLWPEEGRVEIPGIGPITVEIAFGGSFFGLVDARKLRLELSPRNSQKLAGIGTEIRQLLNAGVKVQHPVKKEINRVDLVEFWHSSTAVGVDCKNVVVFGDGQIDRSPCGTGVCAKMASLFAQGELGLNQDFVSESIIGTRFRGRLLEVTRVGNLPAVVPEITGRAFITGIQEFTLHPEDPLKYGFLLTKTLNGGQGNDGTRS